MVRVAINGFGRIGRNFMRCWLQRKANSKLEIVGINDTSDPRTNAHLLKYDSMLGIFQDAEIRADDDCIYVDEHAVKCVSDRNPENLPWSAWGIDLVIEATGVFTSREGASKHLSAGAKKVLITAPGKGNIPTYVVGVNHHTYDPSEDIVSNASCTTNCLAPIVKVLHETFGIQQGMMTTTHSYTGDQRLLDASHRDLRRARAAAMNIVPTSTGAAKAVGLVIPELQGKLNGIALRVPTPNVSVVDFVAQVEKPTIAEQVNQVIKEASETTMKGIIHYSELELVSSDYRGHNASSILDASLTMVMGGTLVKVVAWYDNEWGYSQRVLDLAEHMAAHWA
ncbi:type I glyceraldehyde-3-phosphate dehydrogenase [uncultured Thermosynechococcus sp.]|uniref:type I glyceraldehyde-3-phosphate dehydrogenase n=1 Tax=uncultured Thermosynechococcus sp. TaxID=436945 RepID=UPI002618D1A2|nr:type I glyceraldehyde-3-phosphate dehydrogenase [uncultured Thermosynechococcus sp.]